MENRHAFRIRIDPENGVLAAFLPETMDIAPDFPTKSVQKVQ
jgi:hypothetical protein